MSALAHLRVTIESLEEACIIRAAGELDASTVAHLRSPLDAARADGRTTILDLSGLSFIDSEGLRVLLAAAWAADDQEWPWFIVRPSAAVVRIIDLTGTARFLPLVVPSSRDEELFGSAASG